MANFCTCCCNDNYARISNLRLKKRYNILNEMSKDFFKDLLITPMKVKCHKTLSNKCRPKRNSSKLCYLTINIFKFAVSFG